MILLLTFLADEKNKNNSDDIISVIDSIENEKRKDGTKLIEIKA